MNHSTRQLALCAALALVTPSLAAAEGFYATAQIGVSQQASNSEPFGNNIAVDADFPGEFDAGDGLTGGLGVGYMFGEHIRIEGRLGHREGSFNERQVGTGERAGEEYVLNGNIESTAFTVEVFHDFSNDSRLTPYVKAGLGLSVNSYSARLGGAGVAAFDPFDGAEDGYYDNYEDGDSTELSWNAGVGSAFELSERTSIYGEYQYAAFGDARTGQDSFTDGFRIEGIAGHEVAVGLRLHF